jgi:two-component system, LuxR family, sensor kinase FixL
MPMPPEARKSEEGQGRGDLGPACLALVHELAEPLTAIGNYLDAAIRLYDADTRSALEKLGEVLEKSQTAVSRANETLRQLRDLLRHKEGAADT